MHGRPCIIVINLEVWSLVHKQGSARGGAIYASCGWWAAIKEEKQQRIPSTFDSQKATESGTAGGRGSPLRLPNIAGSRDQASASQHQKQPLLPPRSCQLLIRAWKEPYCNTIFIPPAPFSLPGVLHPPPERLLAGGGRPQCGGGPARVGASIRGGAGEEAVGAQPVAGEGGAPSGGPVSRGGRGGVLLRALTSPP